MELIRQTKGRVLYASLDEIWLARGDALFVSKDKGQDFHFVCRLPVTSKKQYFSKSSLLRRLLRIGIKHLLPLGDEKFLLQGNRCISIWDQKKNIFLHHHQLHGSNPLAICQDNQGFLYYGEYFSNPNRQPVKVWRSVNQGKTWSPIYQFEHIRHIHGIYFDAISQTLWLTTGDMDNESAIWRTDLEWTHLQKIWHGAQKYRAIDLVFTQNYIYYGTDTPLAQNYLYRFDRQQFALEPQVPVEGSVFHGCKTKDWVFFSTACEPSDVNDSREVVLWGRYQEQDWQRLATFKKDCWSMKYFQYGQLYMVAADANKVWITPFATAQHETSYCFSFNEVL